MTGKSSSRLFKIVITRQISKCDIHTLFRLISHTYPSHSSLILKCCCHLNISACTTLVSKLFLKCFRHDAVKQTVLQDLHISNGFIKKVFCAHASHLYNQELYEMRCTWYDENVTRRIREIVNVLWWKSCHQLPQCVAGCQGRPVSSQ